MPENRRCRCGHDRNHPLVVRKNRYSKWGWFALLLGISANPILVQFACIRCGEVFDETNDPEELKKYIT
ncbi:MAG: hypothetical protein N2Z22_09175 [Turneriella sp.]|nr:hypothetical protein [Turneriella sp.]